MIEVIVVLGVLFIVAALVLLPTRGGPMRAPRIQCVNNLKQMGLAYRVWEGDHGDKYPMAVSETNGGTMEYITGPTAFRHFQVMSNELMTPKILICPADAKRLIARDWNIGNSNISYFVGVDAQESNVMTFLGGDRNITNGIPVKNGLLELAANSHPGWTTEMHNHVGNVLMADGSVQQLSTSGLHGSLMEQVIMTSADSAVTNTSGFTNRLQMPELGP